MKKKIAVKKKQRSKNFYAIWIAVFMVVVVQIVMGIELIKIEQSRTGVSKDQISSAINVMEEKRYRYPVIDISENRVYIPEAHIFLPLNETSRNLRYTLESKFLNLSTIFTVGRQFDSDSPSCDRVIVVSVSEEGLGGEYELAGEMQPNVSNLRYIFKHTDKSCSIYTKDLVDDLANTAKEAQRY
ncbi:MAG: hypothetical protein ACOH18_01040 [Candidatus Saccharimonadaceae bacterium]